MKHTKIMLLANALGISPAALFTSAPEPAPAPLSLSAQEEALVKTYRQLNADGREDVDDYVDMKLAKLQRKAEEEETSLG